MNHFIKLSCICLGLSVLQAQAANVSIYGDRTDFINDTGANVTQDFSSYNVGDDMKNKEFMPGVSATTNLENLEIFGGKKRLFALTRDKTEAYYEINFNQSYRNFGFNIEAYNPAAPSPGIWQINFADGDYLESTYAQTGSSESDPMFFGIVSDTDISSIRWYEPAEIDFSCCEETGLDNFIAVNEVPLPAGLWLFGSAIVALLSKKQK